MDPNDPAALLDQLMGSTRNMTETEKATARPAWEEEDVCQMPGGLLPERAVSRVAEALRPGTVRKVHPSPFVRIIRRKTRRNREPSVGGSSVGCSGSFGSS